MPDQCSCVQHEDLCDFSVLLASLHMEQGFPPAAPAEPYAVKRGAEKAALFRHCLAVLALDQPLMEA